MTCTHYNFPVPEEKMVRVITDTDLCNEADDPFAVVQALLSPKFDNVGVVAAHFGTRDPNGMQKSWQGLKRLDGPDAADGSGAARCAPRFAGCRYPGAQRRREADHP